MVRIVGAILGGNAVIGILALLTGQILPVVIPGFRTMTTVPLSFYVALIVSDTLYAMVGGYVCAAIAGAATSKATLGLMILGEIGSVAAAVWFWQYLPLWFSLAVMVLFPLGVWAGSRLRSTGRSDA
jgi:hypothetical protein